MVRKKVDPRVRQLIENSVKLRQRGLLVLVGDHGKDQVVNLHLMLSKTQVKARPSVLWCYKKEVCVCPRPLDDVSHRHGPRGSHIIFERCTTLSRASNSEFFLS
jgi:tRNA(Met) C34 N-acetyltransferase TmcA